MSDGASVSAVDAWWPGSLLAGPDHIPGSLRRIPQAGSEYARSPRPGAALLDVTELRKTYPLGRRVKARRPRPHQHRTPSRQRGEWRLASVRAGEVLGLVGESGSGKSTLGRSIVRLVDASDGQIRFDGKDVTQARGEALHKFRSDVQIIFQNPASSLNPRRRVGATIGRSLDLLGKISKQDRQARIRGTAPIGWIAR